MWYVLTYMCSTLLLQSLEANQALKAESVVAHGSEQQYLYTTQDLYPVKHGFYLNLIPLTIVADTFVALQSESQVNYGSGIGSELQLGYEFLRWHHDQSLASGFLFSSISLNGVRSSTESLWSGLSLQTLGLFFKSRFHLWQRLFSTLEPQIGLSFLDNELSPVKTDLLLGGHMGLEYDTYMRHVSVGLNLGFHWYMQGNYFQGSILPHIRYTF